MLTAGATSTAIASAYLVTSQAGEPSKCRTWTTGCSRSRSYASWSNITSSNRSSATGTVMKTDASTTSRPATARRDLGQRAARPDGDDLPVLAAQARGAPGPAVFERALWGWSRVDRGSLVVVSGVVGPGPFTI